MPVPVPQSKSDIDKRLAELARQGFYICKDRVVVYTDASQLHHVPGRIIGVGLFWGDREGSRASSMLSGERPPPGVTNTTHAEFYAVIRAIELHPDPMVGIEVRTDSKQALHFFRKYREYRGRNWKKLKKSTPLDATTTALLKRLARTMKHLTCPVVVAWVKGHAGDWRNHQADRLAKAAARGIHVYELDDSEDSDDGNSVIWVPDSDDVVEIPDSEDEVEMVVIDPSDEVIVISDSDEDEADGTNEDDAADEADETNEDDTADGADETANVKRAREASEGGDDGEGRAAENVNGWGASEEDNESEEYDGGDEYLPEEDDFWFYDGVGDRRAPKRRRVA